MGGKLEYRFCPVEGKLLIALTIPPWLCHGPFPLSEVEFFPLKANGDRAFCSGTDVVDLYRLLDEGWSLRGLLSLLLIREYIEVVPLMFSHKLVDLI